ncbi:MAG: chorismate mutase [Vampirovibrionales bacterium]
MTHTHCNESKTAEPLWQLRSVRGATSIEADTPEAIREATQTLLHALVNDNHITPDAVCAVFFTLTEDIHALAPARVARECLPWHDVALFMAQEPHIDGLPHQLIRVLIQFETPLARHELTHCYHGRATVLRPDRIDAVETTTHEA